MKISIAVPSLNYGRFIGACLTSIASQTHRDFEVLIADGGSTDHARSVIDEYVAADSRFRLVSTSDRGQAEAINIALAGATGEIHCYLNSDDQFLCNDALEAAVAAFTAYPSIDLFEFKGWFIDEASRPLRPAKLRYHPRDTFAWMRYRTAVLQPATLWRASVTKRFPFDPALHFVFDGLFFYRVARECAWMELEKPIAGVRTHPDNKSTSVRAVRVREIAHMEAIKFGRGSFRSLYLSVLAGIIAVAERIPVIGKGLCRLVYLFTNSLAYLSFYRLPGI